MEGYAEIAALPLFAGTDAEGALAACKPRVRVYRKGERILSAGERCAAAGVLLEGGALIVKEDARGDLAVVARVGEGELFAEAFAFAGEPLTVSVTAAEDARVLWLDAAAIVAGHIPALTANALRLAARKNLFLTERIEHLTRHSLREKVLSCLRAASRRAGGGTFTLPLGRQELADYLGCDRSALSAVLSRLKREGVLDVHKSTFRLLRP